MTSRHLAAVPEEPKRAVLYVRVSALMGRGGADFHSPEIQIGGMRRVTAGMTEVEVVDDDIDRTGRDFEREGIARIRQLAEAGQIDTLAVYNISRFGRNTLEGLQFLNWLAEHGVQIISATEHIDTSTPSGRWMLTNYLALAEMRSDEIGAAWTAIIDKRARDGKTHGPPPTGYVRGDDGRLLPHPAHGNAVAAAFEAYAEGREVSAIRRDLRAATGLKLATVSLKRMLRNRAYLGEVHVGSIVKDDAHEPLVGEDVWWQVQARLRQQTRIPPRLVDPQYPLSGLGRCGVCHGRANHRTHKGWARIFCSAQVKDGACSGFGTPNAFKAADAVLEATKVWSAELRDRGAIAASTAKTRRQATQATAVDAEITETRKAMARTTEAWARGRIPDHAYEATMAALSAEEANLTAALDELRQDAAAPRREDQVALVDRLAELWPQMSPAQKNRALRQLIEHVTIMPPQRYRHDVSERIEVKWR